MAYQKSRVSHTPMQAAMASVDLIYHAIVKGMNDRSGGALLGIVFAMMQTMVMFVFFFLMFSLLGMKSVPIRGDFVIFLLSGISLFLIHNSAISATVGGINPLNPLLKHAPMTLLVTLVSANFSSLYIQGVSMALVFSFTLLIRPEVTIMDPVGLVAMALLAWGSGIGVGLIFSVISPIAPKLFGLVRTLYMRLNMITSGKMFVANVIPAMYLPFFAWNPLFHTIDQARGFAFVNYFPRNTNIDYPIYFTIVCCIFGLMGNHWRRRTASASDSARETF